jgi:RNA polymerase sigma-70 factor
LTVPPSSLFARQTAEVDRKIPEVKAVFLSIGAGRPTISSRGADMTAFPDDAAASGQEPPVEPLALFEILVRENADALTAFLRASVDDRAAAEDLFQETMLVAWRKIGSYDRARPFGAWLRGIARMLVLAHYRRGMRETPLSEDQLEYVDEQMTHIEHQSGDTFDEKIAALRDCVARLEPEYRQTIEMHYQQGKTTDWMAAQLAITREAIQKRLQRARQQLAECLQRKAVLSPVDRGL